MAGWIAKSTAAKFEPNQKEQKGTMFALRR
jgi:hypothetical protein